MGILFDMVAFYRWLETAGQDDRGRACGSEVSSLKLALRPFARMSEALPFPVMMASKAAAS